MGLDYPQHGVWHSVDSLKLPPQPVFYPTPLPNVTETIYGRLPAFSEETLEVWRQQAAEALAQAKAAVRDEIVAAHDPVKSPSHYNAGRKYEPIKVIPDWGLSYNVGSAVAYLSRLWRKLPDAGQTAKQKAIEDIRKAITHLEAEIAHIEERDE